MSKRKKASVLALNKRHGFRNFRHVVHSATTGVAKMGILYLDASTAGVATGDVYITVDTSGTGTQIDV